MVDNDFASLAFRVLAVFLVCEAALALTGLGALLLLLGGAMMSLSISEGGSRLCDRVLEGAAGRSGSVLVAASLPAVKSSGRGCGCDCAGGAGGGALDGEDSLRLRERLSGVDSSSGKKSSRSWSSIDDSGASINRRILGCLFRILIGPKMEVSAVGIS